jgi:hypothetical protein
MVSAKILGKFHEIPANTLQKHGKEQVCGKVQAFQSKPGNPGESWGKQLSYMSSDVKCEILVH